MVSVNFIEIAVFFRCFCKLFCFVLTTTMNSWLIFAKNWIIFTVVLKRRKKRAVCFVFNKNSGVCSLFVCGFVDEDGGDFSVAPNRPRSTLLVQQSCFNEIDRDPYPLIALCKIHSHRHIYASIAICMTKKNATKPLPLLLLSSHTLTFWMLLYNPFSSSHITQHTAHSTQYSQHSQTNKHTQTQPASQTYTYKHASTHIHTKTRIHFALNRIASHSKLLHEY